MATLNLNLTQEQYNQLIDYINNNQSLSNILIQDNQNINKNLISIRTLSIDEYDDFIINNNLNGSIIKNDIKVWNYIKPLNDYGLLISGTFEGWQLYNDTELHKTWYSYLTMKPYGCTMSSQYPYSIFECVKIGAYVDIQTVRNKRTCLELFSTNTSSKFLHLQQNNKFIVAVSCQTNGGTHYLVCVNTITVNMNSNSKSLPYKLMSVSSGNEARQCISTINVYYDFCFRPVLQYVDNHKSSNIHY